MADTEFSALAGTNVIAPDDQLLVVRNGVARRFNGILPVIDANGKIGLGSASPYCPFEIARSDQSAARIGIINTLGRTYHLVAGVANQSQFGFSLYDASAGQTRWIVDANGHFSPGMDNAQQLGSSGFRWSVLYAGTGTIQTSDQREKHWRGELTPAHIRAARRIFAEIGIFQWNDAIAEKGVEGARLHIGPRAQAVARVMVEEGLEDEFEGTESPNFRHAFLCYDRWDATPARPAVPEERDAAGGIVVAAEPAVAEVPAGDRYGLRIDQLTMFLLAALLGGGEA